MKHTALPKTTHSQKRIYVQEDYAVSHTTLCNDNVDFAVLAKALLATKHT